MSDKHPAEVLANRIQRDTGDAIIYADAAAKQLRGIPALEAERDDYLEQRNAAQEELRLCQQDAINLQAERDKLRAEVEAMRADAERYQAWRIAYADAVKPDGSIAPMLIDLADAVTEQEVDAAIDAARGAT